MSNKVPTMQELEEINPHLKHINRMRRLGQTLRDGVVYLCWFDGESFWGRWNASTQCIHGFHEDGAEMVEGIEDLDNVGHSVEEHHRLNMTHDAIERLRTIPQDKEHPDLVSRQEVENLLIDLTASNKPKEKSE